MFTDRRAFATLAFCILVSQVGYFMTFAALPLYLHHVGAPTARVGLEFGTGSIAGLAVTLACGPLISRHPTRLFLASGAALYLLGFVVMLLFPAEWVLVGARLLQGAGYSVIGPSALSAIPRLASRSVGSVLGLTSTIGSTALAIGPALGLALYQHGGAHWLLVPGAALAAVAVLAALTLDIPAAGAQPVDSRTLEETAGVTKRGGILGRLIKGYGYDRSWTGLLIANGLNGVYFGGISAYLPLFMHAIHGPNAGIFFTADAVGVLLLRWPAGILADRTRPLVPITLGILITLAGLAAFIPAQSVITLALAGAGTGIGAGLFANGLLTDLTQRSTSANRGTAMSLSFLTPGLGVFIGAGFSGALYGPGGFGAIILFGALAEAVGLPVLLLAHRRPKAEYLPAR